MEHQFMNYPGGRRKAVTFSYDDGTAFDLPMVQILNRYGIKATFNLTSNFDTPGHISAQDIRQELLGNGHEIAVHCSDHRAPGVTRTVAGIRQVLDGRDILEKTFGIIVRGMAYPNSGITQMVPGNDYPSIRHYLQELDIAYARSLGGDNDSFALPTDWYNWIPTAHHDNPNLDSYIEKFSTLAPVGSYYPSGQPRLFYLWGHSFEFQNNHNWDRLEAICQKLGGHQEIWYATNMEIYTYVTAYQSLVYSADESIVYNPTLQEIWFERDRVKYQIHPGETITIRP